MHYRAPGTGTRNKPLVYENSGGTRALDFDTGRTTGGGTYVVVVIITITVLNPRTDCARRTVQRGNGETAVVFVDCIPWKRSKKKKKTADRTVNEPRITGNFEYNAYA